MENIATLYPHQAHSLSVEKDETEMRKKPKGILESLPASPRSLGNPFDLPKIFSEEGNDTI
jgi:hypothetical protein